MAMTLPLSLQQNVGKGAVAMARDSLAGAGAGLSWFGDFLNPFTPVPPLRQAAEVQKRYANALDWLSLDAPPDPMLQAAGQWFKDTAGPPLREWAKNNPEQAQQVVSTLTNPDVEGAMTLMDTPLTPFASLAKWGVKPLAAGILLPVRSMLSSPLDPDSMQPVKYAATRADAMEPGLADELRRRERVAETMLEEGAGPSQIARETNLTPLREPNNLSNRLMYRDQPERWPVQFHWEVPTGHIQTPSIHFAGTRRMDDVINDPGFWRAFPELRDTEFKIYGFDTEGGSLGAYSPREQAMRMWQRNLGNVTPEEVMWHEFMHNFQHLFNLPDGSSPKSFRQDNVFDLVMDSPNAARKRMLAHMQKERDAGNEAMMPMPGPESTGGYAGDSDLLNRVLMDLYKVNRNDPDYVGTVDRILNKWRTGNAEFLGPDSPYRKGNELALDYLDYALKPDQNFPNQSVTGAIQRYMEVIPSRYSRYRDTRGETVANAVGQRYHMDLAQQMRNPMIRELANQASVPLPWQNFRYYYSATSPGSPNWRDEMIDPKYVLQPEDYEHVARRYLERRKLNQEFPF